MLNLVAFVSKTHFPVNLYNDSLGICINDSFGAETFSKTRYEPTKRGLFNLIFKSLTCVLTGETLLLLFSLNAYFCNRSLRKEPFKSNILLKQ